MVSDLKLKDWNFASVPDEELQACLLWEYGRESRTFTYLDDHHEASRLIQPKRWDIELQKWIRTTADERNYAEYQFEMLGDVGFDPDKFLESYESFDLCYTQIYETIKTHARPWSEPWQDLPVKWREQIKKEAINPSPFGPISPAWLIDLEALWNSNSEYLNQIRSDPKRKSDPLDDSEDFALHSETQPLIKSKEHSFVAEFVAVFNIDFRRFTNSEIAAEFLNFLKEHRPEDKPPPARRGKKLNDARCSLEWLGAMRALHHWQWRSPEFPSLIKDKGENICYKARKRAKEKFHQLFPFLPLFEEPWSWETKAVGDKRRRLSANHF